MFAKGVSKRTLLPPFDEERKAHVSPSEEEKGRRKSRAWIIAEEGNSRGGQTSHPTQKRNVKGKARSESARNLVDACG